MAGSCRPVLDGPREKSVRGYYRKLSPVPIISFHESYRDQSEDASHSHIGGPHAVAVLLLSWWRLRSPDACVRFLVAGWFMLVTSTLRRCISQPRPPRPVWRLTMTFICVGNICAGRFMACCENQVSGPETDMHTQSLSLIHSTQKQHN